VELNLALEDPFESGRVDQEKTIKHLPALFGKKIFKVSRLRRPWLKKYREYAYF
jgi:hypothetical protein